MCLRIVRFTFFLALCLLSSALLKAQSWRPLTMNDFQGVPPGGNAPYIAYTNCQIQYNYDARRYNDGQYQLTFYVSMVMNHNKSWMNKVRAMESGQLEEILRHEQGHYNIAYLEQQELLQAFNQARYSADYQYQVSTTFEAVDRKYRNMNQEYEQGTQHMLNRAKQNEWNAWFRDRMNDMRSYAYQAR